MWRLVRGSVLSELPLEAQLLEGPGLGVTVSCHLLVSGADSASLTSGTLPCPVSSHGHQLGSVKRRQQSCRGAWVWGEGSRAPAPCPSRVRCPSVEAARTETVTGGGSARALAVPEAGACSSPLCRGTWEGRLGRAPGKGALGEGEPRTSLAFQKRVERNLAGLGQSGAAPFPHA